MSERLDRIEEMLISAQEQRLQDRRDWLERDRQLTEKLDQVAQQQTQFQDGLNETKALQQQNAKAISQLTSNIEQLRQATASNATNNSDTRTELARHASNPDAHGTSP